MRRFMLFFSALVLGTTAQAQTVATFEDLTLPKPDTFYVNYSASGTDVGFNDGLAHFPCVYDTDFGGYWNYGFAYSNMRDSVTSGFTNQYAAKTDTGYGPSNNYVVAYGAQNMVKLRGAAIGKPVSGFYVTNNTYAFNSMRDGDAFARKFHNGDWFKLTIHGYSGGIKKDSVSTYLADFLFPDSSMNYILKTWQWVNLLSLGGVDSLEFDLSSTDNGSFGMNTPAYFCMDNFTTDETYVPVDTTHSHVAVNSIASAVLAKVYPNPAMNMLYADITDNAIEQAQVIDMAGNILSTYTVTQKQLAINISSLPPGIYILQLVGNSKTANARFVKQ